MLKPPRFFLVYLEVCLQSVISHGAFWKMKCLQAWAFCFPKCHSSFFPCDTCQYHGKKIGSIFKLSNALEPGEFWKEALCSSTSGGCLLLELSAPRALPYTERTPDRQYARRNCEYYL